MIRHEKYFLNCGSVLIGACVIKCCERTENKIGRSESSSAGTRGGAFKAEKCPDTMV